MQVSRLKHWLVIMSLLTPTVAFADEVITKAQELMKAGDYKAAYELLEPLETERSGDVQYDMLLGVSGVEAGENARGVFALERVLAAQPNNLKARAMLAKGYYKSGESTTAKRESGDVLKQNPDAEVSKIIEDNLLAIDKAAGQATAFAAYLDFGIGHDSNINSATSTSSVTGINPIFPFLGLTTIPLNGSVREQSSNFVNAAGGISFRTPLSNDVSAFGSLAGTNKFNWSNGDFDQSSLNYSLGININHKVDNYTLALQGGSYSVNGDTFRDAIGLNAQWQHNLDSKNQLNVYAQIFKFEYPDSDIRSVKRYVVGGALRHAFDGDKAKVAYIGAYAGKEKADDGDFDFVSNDLFGARIGGQMALNYKLVAFTGASYEYRNYDGQDLTFLKDRKDNQFDFNVGLKYLLDNKITVKPQISYMKNNSNIEFYEFDRWIVSVNIRKDFNW